VISCLTGSFASQGSQCNRTKRGCFRSLAIFVDEEGRAIGAQRYLIIDCDAKYTARFRELIEKDATALCGRLRSRPI
jgi:hypothetical protein